jgi:hypothetical protein
MRHLRHAIVFFLKKKELKNEKIDLFTTTFLKFKSIAPFFGDE